MSSEMLARAYGEPGTLYSKCGGVFGVAAFADRCMDKWMADPTLNANAAVTTWHHKAQRCGFKFLVVQICGALSGGPQQYTGRDMHHAHAHLNISEREWEKFMELFNEVCSEFGLPPDVADDLNMMMISMEDDIVIRPGMRVPPNPGARAPSGASLYARAGGVYPLALFVDRLVDALLEDERVQIPLDHQKRNEASLKYLFLELVCNLCGGPEVVTAKDLEETKLLVPKGAWRIFLATVEEAADHLPAAVRPGLGQVFQRSKALIVDQASADVDPAAADSHRASVKTLIDAAGGRMLSAQAVQARHAAPGAIVAARKRVVGDPRTLYGRSGGIFNLVRLVDKLMDVWMANPTLNANGLVARWHQSQQKYGFKFLVTQIMGYLTGGPQRYTGRPMDEAHKHLNISPAEWESFIEDADRVFTEFRCDQRTHQELMSIIKSFRSQCVVSEGEPVPADPGAPQANPASVGSLYHNLGGVYPIAQYADRLVEAVLKGDKCRVESHRVDDLEGDPSLKRHPPALKYMVTELLCSATGGPEVVTSKGFDGAKLGIQPGEWDTFLVLAAESATVWPSAHLRTALMSALASMKKEFCVGDLEEDEPSEAGANTSITRILGAGFNALEAAAALESSNGDVVKAMELLSSGWTPVSDSMSMASTATLHPPDAPRCPFGFTAADGPRCPFGFTSAKSTPSAPAGGGASSSDAAGPLDPEKVDAARILVEKGIPIAAVAGMLSIDAAALTAELEASAPAAAGRVLGSALQAKLDDLLSEDPDLCCPITLVVFSDPVVASDGILYERKAIQQLIRGSGVSPTTREPLTAQIITAQQKKREAAEFREARTKELLAFGEEALAQGDKSMASSALERVGEYFEVMKPTDKPEMAKRAVQLFVNAGVQVPLHLAPTRS